MMRRVLQLRRSSPVGALTSPAIASGSSKHALRGRKSDQAIAEFGFITHDRSSERRIFVVDYFRSFRMFTSTVNDNSVPSAVANSVLLSEKEFHIFANETLHHLQEKIEAYGEDIGVDGFDVDHAEGVLTVRFGSLGTYVINKQTPNRQIWLSSPVSGPARFDWNKSESSWIYRRTKAELISLLEKELSNLLGAKIDLRKD